MIKIDLFINYFKNSTIWNWLAWKQFISEM